MWTSNLAFIGYGIVVSVVGLSMIIPGKRAQQTTIGEPVTIEKRKDQSLISENSTEGVNASYIHVSSNINTSLHSQTAYPETAHLETAYPLANRQFRVKTKRSKSKKKHPRSKKKHTKSKKKKHSKSKSSNTNTMEAQTPYILAQAFTPGPAKIDYVDYGLQSANTKTKPVNEKSKRSTVSSNKANLSVVERSVADNKTREITLCNIAKEIMEEMQESQNKRIILSNLNSIDSLMESDRDTRDRAIKPVNGAAPKQLPVHRTAPIVKSRTSEKIAIKSEKPKAPVNEAASAAKSESSTVGAVQRRKPETPAINSNSASGEAPVAKQKTYVIRGKTRKPLNGVFPNINQKSPIDRTNANTHSKTPTKVVNSAAQEITPVNIVAPVGKLKILPKITTPVTKLVNKVAPIPKLKTANPTKSVDAIGMPKEKSNQEVDLAVEFNKLDSGVLPQIKTEAAAKHTNSSKVHNTVENATIKKSVNLVLPRRNSNLLEQNVTTDKNKKSLTNGADSSVNSKTPLTNNVQKQKTQIYNVTSATVIGPIKGNNPVNKSNPPVAGAALVKKSRTFVKNIRPVTETKTKVDSAVPNARSEPYYSNQVIKPKAQEITDAATNFKDVKNKTFTISMLRTYIKDTNPLIKPTILENIGPRAKFRDLSNNNFSIIKSNTFIKSKPKENSVTMTEASTFLTTKSNLHANSHLLKTEIDVKSTKPVDTQSKTVLNSRPTPPTNITKPVPTYTANIDGIALLIDRSVLRKKLKPTKPPNGTASNAMPNTSVNGAAPVVKYKSVDSTASITKTKPFVNGVTLIAKPRKPGSDSSPEPSNIRSPANGATTNKNSKTSINRFNVTSTVQSRSRPVNRGVKRPNKSANVTETILRPKLPAKNAGSIAKPWKPANKVAPIPKLTVTVNVSNQKMKLETSAEQIVETAKQRSSMNRASPITKPWRTVNKVSPIYNSVNEPISKEKLNTSLNSNASKLKSPANIAGSIRRFKSVDGSISTSKAKAPINSAHTDVKPRKPMYRSKSSPYVVATKPDKITFQKAKSKIPAASANLRPNLSLHVTYPIKHNISMNATSSITKPTSPKSGTTKTVKYKPTSNRVDAPYVKPKTRTHRVTLKEEDKTYLNSTLTVSKQNTTAHQRTRHHSRGKIRRKDLSRNEYVLAALAKSRRHRSHAIKRYAYSVIPFSALRIHRLSTTQRPVHNVSATIATRRRIFSAKVPFYAISDNYSKNMRMYNMQPYKGQYGVTQRGRTSAVSRPNRIQF